jgi:hypothetical protein
VPKEDVAARAALLRSVPEDDRPSEYPDLLAIPAAADTVYPWTALVAFGAGIASASPPDEIWAQRVGDGGDEEQPLLASSLVEVDRSTPPGSLQDRVGLLHVGVGLGGVGLPVDVVATVDGAAAARWTQLTSQPLRLEDDGGAPALEPRNFDSRALVVRAILWAAAAAAGGTSNEVSLAFLCLAGAALGPLRALVPMVVLCCHTAVAHWLARYHKVVAFFAPESLASLSRETALPLLDRLLLALLVAGFLQLPSLPRAAANAGFMVARGRVEPIGNDLARLDRIPVMLIDPTTGFAVAGALQCVRRFFRASAGPQRLRFFARDSGMPQSQSKQHQALHLRSRTAGSKRASL